jgi:hypothetical protein
MAAKHALMKTSVQATLALTFLTAAILSPVVFATAPAIPNCLGQDLKNFAQVDNGFVGDVASGLSESGFDNEILGHLQGVPGFSSCPDDGFPTPTH